MRSNAQGDQGQKSPLLVSALLETLFSTSSQSPVASYILGHVSTAVHHGHGQCACSQISLEAADPENEECATQNGLPMVSFPCPASCCQEERVAVGTRAAGSGGCCHLSWIKQLRLVRTMLEK